MSDTATTPGADQMAAAAARRQRAAEAAAAPADGATPRRAMQDRTPFGTKQQKLAYPARPNFHRHWFNDDPGRIDRALAAGYVHVQDEAGRNVSTVVGVARGGGPLIGYLMEIPEEWYREDMAAQESGYRDMISQIKEGNAPGTPGGADGAARYVGKQGIAIREASDRR